MWVQISLPSSSFITSPPLSLSTSPSLFSFWSYGRSQLAEALKQKGKNKGTPLTAVTYLAICLWLRTTIKICVKGQNATEHNYTQISSTTSTVYEGEDLVAIAGRLFKCSYSFTFVSSVLFEELWLPRLAYRCHRRLCLRAKTLMPITESKNLTEEIFESF